MIQLEVPEVFNDLRIIDPGEKVVFCKKCVISNQRPRVHFNKAGICGQCLYHEYKRTTINWDKREKELKTLCDKYRSKDSTWDVIVPGSGGKDSCFVAYSLKKKYGMHPLTVTWGSAIPTDIGLRNFINYTSQFDNILLSPNGEFHRKLSKITFSEFGDNFLPFIYGQLNSPLQIAVKYNIPFIMYGENGEVENGGSLKNFDKAKMNIGGQDYFQQFTTNYPPEYWVKNFDVDINELKNRYMPPSDNELKRVGVEEYFFSYFENYSPQKSYEIAKKFCGFRPNPDGRSEGTFTDFASLDDKTDGFHYYMAFIKFGIGRATADAVKQIWNGLMTRDEGVNFVQKYDSEFPAKYLKEFLEYMELDLGKLNRIIDKFRRTIIWNKEDDEWKLRHQVTKL